MSQPVTTTHARVQAEVMIEPQELEDLPKDYRNLSDLLLERAIEAIRAAGEEPKHLEPQEDALHWHVHGVDAVPHKPAANGVVFRVEVSYR